MTPVKVPHIVNMISGAAAQLHCTKKDTIQQAGTISPRTDSVHITVSKLKDDCCHPPPPTGPQKGVR